MVLTPQYLMHSAVWAATVVCVAAPFSVFAQHEHGPSIRDISPVQLYSVTTVSVPPPVALPAADDDDAGQGLKLPAPAVATPQTPPPAPLSLGYIPMSFTPASIGNAAWSSGNQTRNTRAQAWLAPPDSSSPLALGARNWRYASASGLDVTVGNAPTQSPLWSQPVRLAGVGIQGAPSGGWQNGAWQYATSVGALDTSGDDAINSGGLAYGPTASDSFIKYDAAPSLSLTSQVQWAPDLFTVGVGGQYGLGSLGSWILGVSKAQQSVGNGWRYQLGYQVDVLDDWKLSWTNTQRGSGYSDLSNYSAGPTSERSVSNQWGVKVPMGRWGDLSGTYDQVNTAQGPTSGTFGLAQQFWYGPDLQLRVEASHNIVTDDYGLGLKLSFPLN